MFIFKIGFIRVIKNNFFGKVIEFTSNSNLCRITVD